MQREPVSEATYGIASSQLATEVRTLGKALRPIALPFKEAYPAQDDAFAILGKWRIFYPSVA